MQPIHHNCVKLEGIHCDKKRIKKSLKSKKEIGKFYEKSNLKKKESEI